MNVFVSQKSPVFEDSLNLIIPVPSNMLNLETLKVITVITVAAIITSAIPAYEAYKNALHSSLGSKN